MSLCSWVSNTQAQAQLPYGSGVEPGQYVTLLANKIKKQCVGSTCSTNSYAPTSTVIISNATTAGKVYAVVDTPTQFSSCESSFLIDATQSTGNAGRAWSTIEWSVSGTDLSTASALQSYLQSNPTVSDLIYAPTSLLLEGTTYNVFLRLVNFVGVSGEADATFEFTSNLQAPLVYIAGKGSISVNVSQSISLLAVANTSSCNTDDSLSYSWTLSAQGQQVDAQSLSKTPRIFELGAYTLTSGIQYTVSVTVMAIVSGASSTSSVSLYVSADEEVKAIIREGKFQIQGNESTLTFDASGSVDVNSPSSSLAFAWDCSIISPNSGDACGLDAFLAQTSQIFIPASATILGTYYQIGVTVTATDGRSGRATTYFTRVASTAPLVEVISTSANHLPNTYTTISSFIVAQAPYNASWTCEQLQQSVLDDLAITPLSKLFPSGSMEYPLRILDHTLIGGLTYTFVLTTKYLDGSLSSSSGIDVYMRQEPTSGTFETTPALGNSLSTLFQLQASSWAAENDALPLEYSFYFTDNTQVQQTLQSPSVVSYVKSYLPQGSAAAAYKLLTTAEIADTFGASTTAAVSIIVQPAFYNISSVQQMLDRSLKVASETGNTDSMLATVGVYSATLNEVNCSAAPNCSALHRSGCADVPHTCGSCLHGYDGIPNSDNSLCVANGQSLYSQCATNVDCASGYCLAGVCSVAPLKCPSNGYQQCSGHGNCTYMNWDGQPLSSCLTNDTFCSAQCVCESGFIDTDCSKTVSDLQSVQDVRDTLISALYNTTNELDVNQKNLATAASLVHAVTAIPQEISPLALLLSLQVISFSSTNLSAITNSTINTNLFGALSNTISVQSQYNYSLRTSQSIRDSVDAVGYALTESMVSGQDEIVIVKDNIRTSSLHPYLFDLSNATFFPPQTVLEKKYSVGRPSLTLSASGLDSCNLGGYSVGSVTSQYGHNPYNTTSNSGILRYSLTSVLGSQPDERLANFTIVLQNQGPVTYKRANISVHEEISCLAGQMINYTVHCDIDNQTHSIQCDGKAKTVLAKCTGSYDEPVCLLYDGVSNIDTGCSVLAHTSYNTTCVCPNLNLLCGSGNLSISKQSTSSRRLASSQAQTQLQANTVEYSSETKVVSGGFVSTTTSVQSVNQNSLTRSSVMLGAIGLWIFLAIAGVVLLTWRKRVVGKKRRDKIPLELGLYKRSTDQTDDEVKALAAELIKNFIVEAVPLWHRGYSWLSSMWKQLLRDHSIISAFNTKDVNQIPEVHWLVVWATVLVQLFIGAVFYRLTNPDSSICQNETLESNCLAHKSYFDSNRHQCSWDSSTGSCKYVQIQNNISIILSIAILTAITSAPFYVLFYWSYRSILSKKPVWDTRAESDAVESYLEARALTKGTILSALLLVEQHEQITLFAPEISDDTEPRDEAQLLVSGTSEGGHLPPDVQQLQASLETQIVQARKDETEIMNGLPPYEEHVQDLILMKNLLLRFLNPLQLRLAKGLLLRPELEYKRKTVSYAIWLITFTVVILIVAFCILYLFLFGALLGSSATSAWLYSTLILLMQEYLLVDVVQAIVIHWAPSHVAREAIIRAKNSLFTLVDEALAALPARLNDDVWHWHLYGADRAATHYPQFVTAQILVLVGELKPQPQKSNSASVAVWILAEIGMLLTTVFSREVTQFIFALIVPASLSALVLLFRVTFESSIAGGVLLIVGLIVIIPAILMPVRCKRTTASNENDMEELPQKAGGEHKEAGDEDEENNSAGQAGKGQQHVSNVLISAAATNPTRLDSSNPHPDEPDLESTPASHMPGDEEVKMSDQTSEEKDLTNSLRGLDAPPSA